MERIQGSWSSAKLYADSIPLLLLANKLNAYKFRYRIIARMRQMSALFFVNQI